MADLPQLPARGSGDLPRVIDAVSQALGLDPTIQRGAILPFGRDASGEMVMAWPQMAVDSLKSLMLPGHVMQGGAFTPRDVTEMALDVGMLSSVAPAPAGAKRMFGGINADDVPQARASLPMDEASRMARATEMGFDPDLRLYHATNKDFDAFDLKMSGSGSNAGNMKEKAVFLTDNPAVADSYLGSVDVDAAVPSAIEHGTADLGGGVGRAYSKGGQVMPVMVRDLDFDNFEVWDYGGGGYRADEMKAALKEARKAGAKGVVFKNIKDPGIRDTIGPVGNPRKPATVVAVFDPAAIRSRFAAFDPARRESADILASYLGVPGIGMLDAMPQDEQPRDQQTTRGSR